MNIKKLASLLFQRSVIVALLIFLQAAMLLLYMLWFSSDFIYCLLYTSDAADE